MHIECMVDGNDGSTYYDVSDDAMKRIRNFIKCISTDGFKINEDVKKEACNLIELIDD